VHFCPHLCTPSKTSWSVTHPEIALGQARLTLEFFACELLEKKVYLGGMSILSILLSLKLGCHTLLWPRTSTPPTVRNYFTILTQVHFAFLTCTFTCLLGWLRITRQRAGIRLCRSPLQPQPNRRIRWQQRGAIVVLHDICVRNELVLLDDICVMNCIVVNLFCLLWNILYLLVMKPVYFLPLLEAPRPREAAKIGSAKKTKQLYSSVNQRTYRATCQSRAQDPTPLCSSATGHRRI
jgi:hypothetical protein